MVTPLLYFGAATLVLASLPLLDFYFRPVAAAVIAYVLAHYYSPNASAWVVLLGALTMTSAADPRRTKNFVIPISLAISLLAGVASGYVVSHSSFSAVAEQLWIAVFALGAAGVAFLSVRLVNRRALTSWAIVGGLLIAWWLTERRDETHFPDWQHRVALLKQSGTMDFASLEHLQTLGFAEPRWVLVAHKAVHNATAEDLRKFCNGAQRTLDLGNSFEPMVTFGKWLCAALKQPTAEAAYRVLHTSQVELNERQRVALSAIKADLLVEAGATDVERVHTFDSFDRTPLDFSNVFSASRAGVLIENAPGELRSVYDASLGAYVMASYTRYGTGFGARLPLPDGGRFVGDVVLRLRGLGQVAVKIRNQAGQVMTWGCEAPVHSTMRSLPAEVCKKNTWADVALGIGTWVEQPIAEISLRGSFAIAKVWVQNR